MLLKCEAYLHCVLQISQLDPICQLRFESIKYLDTNLIHTNAGIMQIFTNLNQILYLKFIIIICVYNYNRLNIDLYFYQNFWRLQLIVRNYLSKIWVDFIKILCIPKNKKKCSKNKYIWKMQHLIYIFESNLFLYPRNL